MKTAIILSGLPASGKTTLGRAIAEHLNMPCLDKDDFLETLFEERGAGDLPWRRQLSRESDKVFRDRAIALEAAVLVSHWQSQQTSENSGTPTDWLHSTCDVIIEVYCDCNPEVAARRFLARQRHSAHLDAMRTPEETLSWMKGLVAGYPLKIGKLLTVPMVGMEEWTDLIDQLTSVLKIELGFARREKGD